MARLVGIAAAALVAIGLAVLLARKSASITKVTYRFGFFLGLAAFVATIMAPSISLFLPLGRNPGAAIILAVAMFVTSVPFILLIEAGFSGYQGFSSWFRYVPLSIAVLGGVGLIASLLLPKMLSWKW